MFKSSRDGKYLLVKRGEVIIGRIRQHVAKALGHEVFGGGGG